MYGFQTAADRDRRHQDIRGLIGEQKARFDRMDKAKTLREWYDGYLFGNKEVYNPWSVINYVNSLTGNPEAFPKPYWSNTSSNSIVKELVEHASMDSPQGF